MKHDISSTYTYIHTYIYIHNIYIIYVYIHMYICICTYIGRCTCTYAPVMGAVDDEAPQEQHLSTSVRHSQHLLTDIDTLSETAGDKKSTTK